MIEKDLIFDIGTHVGEDAINYAWRGYKVIAVDADPSIIAQNKEKYSEKYPGIAFLNYAADSKDDGEIELFINGITAQNSVIEAIGKRQNTSGGSVKVPTTTLKKLTETYGVPFYCKIDIEGHDAVATRSLKGASELPTYISVETECPPDDRKLAEEGVLETLDALREVGYTKFKLVDQSTLKVLGDEDYYKKRDTLVYKVIRKLQKMTGRYSETYTNKQRLTKAHGYQYVFDASGPFGEELDGEWRTYEAARKLYLWHRRAFFQVKGNQRFSFWADWHATR